MKIPIFSIATAIVISVTMYGYKMIEDLHITPPEVGLALELRPSIGSLEIWLGSLENSPARPRSRSKCSNKKSLDFCSDRKKIENFMLEIAWIESQCSI